MEHYLIKVCQNNQCNQDALELIEKVFIYKAFDEKTTEASKEELFIMAFADGEKAGAAKIVFFENTAELSAIAVLPIYQRQGVGRDIMREVIKQTQDKVASLTLSSPASSRAFFFSLGFKETDAPYLVNNTAFQKMVMEYDVI